MSCHWLPQSRDQHLPLHFSSSGAVTCSGYLVNITEFKLFFLPQVTHTGFILTVKPQVTSKFLCLVVFWLHPNLEPDPGICTNPTFLIHHPISPAQVRHCLGLPVCVSYCYKLCFGLGLIFSVQALCLLYLHCQFAVLSLNSLGSEPPVFLQTEACEQVNISVM